MRNTRILSKLTIAALAAFTVPTYGAITYVDATADNTTSDTDPWFTSGGVTESQNGTWNLRSVTGPANNDTVIEGMTTIMPVIKTSVTGLADNDYYVWVFFWDSSGVDQTWKIEAGLTTGLIATYSFDGAGDTASTVAAPSLTFNSSVVTSDGAQTLYGVNLGQVTVSSGSSIDVFVTRTDTTGGFQRTRYDGVGFEVVPEPSAALLGCLGTLCLLRRRRQVIESI